MKYTVSSQRVKGDITWKEIRVKYLKWLLSDLDARIDTRVEEDDYES